MINNKLYIFVSILILFVIGCTNDNSNLGFPGSDINNHQTVLNDSIFIDMKTYQLDIDVFPDNAKLIVGNYDSTNVRSLIRFANLPTEISLIEDPILSLYLNHQHNSENLNLKIAKLENNIFMQNYATWEKFNETEEWTQPGGDFTDSLSFTIDFDSEVDTLKISFSLPKEIFQDWIDKNDIYTNYGLILYSEDTEDSFLDFYSSEAGIDLRPNVSLKYKDSTNEEITDIRNVTHDTFIHNQIDEELNSEELIISNIPPKCIYFTFDINHNDFDDLNSEEELQKININQAQLIFSINPETTLSYDSFLIGMGIPYDLPDINNLSDSFDITNMWLFSSTIDYVNKEDNTLTINITPIIQHILSKNRPNNGIYLINNQKNMDFSHINVYGPDEDNVNLRPKINIKYSTLD
jgi:hypothetical protein